MSGMEEDMDIVLKKDIERIQDEEKGDEEKIDERNFEDNPFIGDEIETPKAGMVFSSDEEIRNYYDNFARRQGFGVAKISSKSGDDGRPKYFSLACARNGKTISTAKGSYHPRPSTKTNCKAKINVTIKEDGRFIISRVYLDHNHALSPGKTRNFRRNKALDSRGKRRSEQNDLAGITLNQNSHSFADEAGCYENLAYGEKEIAKARQSRLGVGDAEALLVYFYRMQSRNPNFFYMIDVDEEWRIKNVFWADARCRAAYDSFGDVISFDTTYLTKSYDMPLAPFVGVNHHGQSMLFGCGLLFSEDTDTYIWLFKSWLTCMLGRSPKAIVTDQCKAIQTSVTEVFPNSRHRLCLWQIMQKLPLKLGELAQYNAIKRNLKNIVYDSVKPGDFEESWLQMVKDYNLENNEWLKSLYEDRHCWVPVFVENTYWAGMSTTQRSESKKAFFDEYVNSKTTLKQFVEQYDNALKSKVEKESKANLDSFNYTLPMITSLSIEKQFQMVYTNDIFKLFQDELRGLMYCNASFVKTEGSIATFEVTESVLGKDGVSWKEMEYEVLYNETECKVQCLCHLFEFKGILCRHAVSILIKKKVKEVPSHYILERWRKDMKRGYTLVKNVYDDFDNNEQRLHNNRLSPLLYEVQELGTVSDDRCELLVVLLGEVKKKLLACEGNQINQGPTMASPQHENKGGMCFQNNHCLFRHSLMYERYEPELAAVSTGSHIDAIPYLGKYDGVLGVLGCNRSH
ncbi:unnamed protein product [Camellia sinensis]